MEIIYEKKEQLVLIGFHTTIKNNEGYEKCPEFLGK